MPKCRDCKFWFRGEKVHYSETSRQWDGKPHPLAGKTVVKRGWALSQNIGQCRGASELILSDQPVLTHSNFGCRCYIFDEGAEKFDHIYIDHRGQQSIEEYRTEMAQQPEYEMPLGVTWQGNGNPNIGIVSYPKSAAEPIILEPKIKPEIK